MYNVMTSHYTIVMMSAAGGGGGQRRQKKKNHVFFFSPGPIASSKNSTQTRDRNPSK
jgi:hypothetical protein